MKIVNYTLIEEHSITALEKRVREYVQVGWQPLGGVQVVKDNGKLRFFQTIACYGD